MRAIASEPSLLSIEGGVPLSGDVYVGGSRKATLALSAAALLVEGRVRLLGASGAGEVQKLHTALEHLGAVVYRDGDMVEVCTGATIDPEGGRCIDRHFHPALLLLGPVLARTGRAVLPVPGPGETGPHSIDVHLKGLARLGAAHRVEAGWLTVEASALEGADIFLDHPSLTATQSLMMAAAGARGRTVLRHAARDPEVVDLATLLVSMGARIRGAGTDVITIDGTPLLSGAEHRVMPDRHEAAFYIGATVATGGAVTVHRVEPEHLLAFLAKLDELGATVVTGDSSVTVAVRSQLRAGLVRALPYPGFPSDFYPLLAASLSQASGTSIISDSISPDRLLCLDEMRRLGVRAAIEQGVAVIHGDSELSGAHVQAKGPMQAAALLMALLAAPGEGILEGAEHLHDHFPLYLRGLLELEGRMRLYQADMKR